MPDRDILKRLESQGEQLNRIENLVKGSDEHPERGLFYQVRDVQKRVRIHDWIFIGVIVTVSKSIWAWWWNFFTAGK